ncbi:hypothetical protein KQI74_23395 [Paenibacillus barcinonensis]|nr:hypothetical protein [Paenibacillus barcinonensis]
MTTARFFIHCNKKTLQDDLFLKYLSYRVQFRGPPSPLLANMYLNEYDQEMEGRGVRVIRYADDIVVLAKSRRVALRLLASSRTYWSKSSSSK